MKIWLTLDDIDPIPLRVVRWKPPEPPSQADVWFEQEFKELMSRKKKDKGGTPEDLQTLEQMYGKPINPDRNVVKYPWKCGMPPRPGLYHASKTMNDNAVRYWSGNQWSLHALATMTADEQRYRFNRKHSRGDGREMYWNDRPVTGFIR